MTIKKEPCGIEKCPVDVCNNKFVWKDKLNNFVIVLFIGSAASIFGMGMWKADIDNNVESLNYQMNETKIEINEIKRSINIKLDTLLERTK